MDKCHIKIHQSCGQEAQLLSEHNLVACPPPTSDPSAVEAQAAYRARDSVVADRCSFPGREKDICRKRSKPTYTFGIYISHPTKQIRICYFSPSPSHRETFKIARDPGKFRSSTSHSNAASATFDGLSTSSQSPHVQIFRRCQPLGLETTEGLESRRRSTVQLMVSLCFFLLLSKSRSSCLGEICGSTHGFGNCWGLGPRLSGGRAVEAKPARFASTKNST